MILSERDRFELIMDRFNAKILLFGEYSVLTGSDALTIPYPKYSGRLLIPVSKTGKVQKRSNRVLYQYVNFLKSVKSLSRLIRFEFDRLTSDLENGLYFNSSVPVQYGLGSSGMLVAAVFKEYTRKDLESFKPEKLRELFALAESFFHGQSSGIDPLTSYTSLPVLYSKERIRLVDQELYHRIKNRFYLYNTGGPAETGNLVSRFLSRLDDMHYKAQFLSDYTERINNLIDQLVRCGNDDIFREMQLISGLQLKYFREMIPDSMVPLWEKGLRSGNYSMKLCGSGGGGYFLVHSQLPIATLNSQFNKTLELV